MMDRDGIKIEVGDKVHYFGWHNMKPVGVIEAIVSEDGRDIATIRPILSKKPGDIRRVSNDIRKISVQGSRDPGEVLSYEGSDLAEWA